MQMDEKKLIDGIFENLPRDLSEEVLMHMDMGITLYVCNENERVCNENFWKQKVGQTYGRINKKEGATWKEMALELYLQSQEEMCFECSQYGPPGELRQCAECTVDLCRLCGDSESGLCMDCQDDEELSSLGGNPLKKFRHKVVSLKDRTYRHVAEYFKEALKDFSLFATTGEIRQLRREFENLLDDFRQLSASERKEWLEEKSLLENPRSSVVEVSIFQEPLPQWLNRMQQKIEFAARDAVKPQRIMY